MAEKPSRKITEHAKPSDSDKLKSEAKQAKLAEALRANLRRRKGQARDRADES